MNENNTQKLDTPILPCCGYLLLDGEFPVFYNVYNKVIQCHSCGHVYEPVKTKEITNE